MNENPGHNCVNRRKSQNNIYTMIFQLYIKYKTSEQDNLEIPTKMMTY